MEGLVGLSVVKNEADIIEVMVRHNLRFLDTLIVVDNASGDETARLLTALAQEFDGRLIVRSDHRVGHLQQNILNRLIRRIAAQYPKVRCFVPLDADELILAEHDAFRDTLMAETRPLRLPWVSYCPCPADNAGEPNPVLRIRHRRASEDPVTHKITFPSDLVGKTILNAGSHRLKGMSRFDTRVADTLQLAHFPIRSKEQLWSKIMIGSLNMKLRGRQGKNEGANWHRLADDLQSSRGVSDDVYFKEAALFGSKTVAPLVEDPVVLHPEDHTLRHPVEAEHQLALKLTAFAAECVRQITKPKD